MRVRLLGPVDLSDDGTVRQVPGLRRKAVLAALAMHSGVFVTTDRLIDLVWGDAVPATGLNTLQRHVSYLRGLLGGRDMIRARERGYLMELPTDVATAEDRLRQARLVDDPASAAAHLRSALEQWRGPSLADVADLPWFGQQGERLDRLRLDATHDLLDARLALGEHLDLVVELETMAAEHPFHERVHGQLMLALYRSGRQADALAAYARLREVLDEELGIRPGGPLRQLHAAILRQDPDVNPPAAVVVVRQPPAVRPAQLPAAVGGFVGRSAALAQLDSWLLDSSAAGPAVAVSVVSGTAGAGKTALAVRWAHQAAAHFPDGQLYLNLRGFDPAGSATQPVDALGTLLGALGVPAARIPADLDARAGLYRSLLAGRRVLVLLDNARDAEQVRPLLPGSPGAAVLVTSRDRLGPLVAAEGARPLLLGLLSDSESYELLQGPLGSAWLAAEPRAAEEIITRCARLPLALAVVAAHAAGRSDASPARLAAELRDAAGALDALNAGDPATDVRSVLSWSYLALEPAQARLFLLLGMHPGPDVGTAAVASLAGLPRGTVAGLLAQLCRANLLIEHLPGRFTFHDLLREYARELAADLGDTSGRGRSLDHYLHTALAATRLFNPSWEPVEPEPYAPGVSPEPIADPEAAQQWFEAEVSVLVGMVDMAYATGCDDPCWQLAWMLTDFLERRGLWQAWETAHLAGLAAADRLGDPRAQAHLHRGLGRLRMWQQRWPEASAQFEQARLRFVGLDDLSGQARAEHNLSQLAYAAGRVADALAHGLRSLDLSRVLGDAASIAKELNTVGWCRAQLGDLAQARSDCEEAALILQELDDPGQEGPVRHSLGYIHHRLGDYEQAIACYERALRLSRRVDDRYAQAVAQDHLGDSRQALGQRDAARQEWTSALLILTELAHPEADLVRAKLREPS